MLSPSFFEVQWGFLFFPLGLHNWPPRRKVTGCLQNRNKTGVTKQSNKQTNKQTSKTNKFTY